MGNKDLPYHFQETALPFCLPSNLSTNNTWWWRVGGTRLHTGGQGRVTTFSFQHSVTKLAVVGLTQTQYVYHNLTWLVSKINHQYVQCATIIHL